MLTFFRRIRKSLVDSNSTSRYLFYAIGEIILVVVGILIALQINNWNEWKKERALEKVVLEDIRSNIERNRELITSAVDTIDEINLSSEIFKRLHNTQTVFTDSLNYHINQATRSGTFLFKLNFDGYESLKSTGFNIIQNESLKDEILSLFEVTYGELLTNLQFANSSYDYNWWKEFFYKPKMDELFPYDKDRILQNKKVLTHIMDTAFLRNDFQASLKRSLGPTEKVLGMIERELGIRD